jgi:DNA-binding transcriptional regulator YiaG
VIDSAENQYRYTASGLDNVYLVGLPRFPDRAGDETITIPYINQLHRLLRQQVAEKVTGLDHKEIRFLRSELGLTQAQLAQHVHKDAQTIGRWERGETPIDGSSEAVLRAMALEDLGERRVSMSELSLRSVQSTASHAYKIDASDPAHYRALAA